MNDLLTNQELIERAFEHIDNGTTDLGSKTWTEPAENYRCEQRFNSEIEMMRRTAVPFCPSAKIPNKGDFHTRIAAGTPLLVVRGKHGEVHAFVNACRHRGMPVAEGSGTARAFVCPYHAWSYSLDGSLINISGDRGFPGVDKDCHGLLRVSAVEHGGLIFIKQKGEISPAELAVIPKFLDAQQTFLNEDTVTDQTNWKLIAETTMEGYHIKALHKNTFYPYGFDNTNIVELFGANSRLVFPFRRIKELRDIAPQDRRIDGMVTTVHNLFPNAVFSILSKHSSLTLFDPIAPNVTKLITYRVANLQADGSPFNQEEAGRDAEFVKGQGLVEDREAAIKIQQAVSSGQELEFTFGLFEKAVVHFHENLKLSLETFEADVQK